MSADVQRLVDIDDRHLARVPLGRSRMLRALSLALFGLTVRTMLPEAASAQAPYPCYGAPRCSCCNERFCCAYPSCTSESDLCHSGTQCWWTCARGWYWICCDWREGSTGALCICSEGTNYEC
jgi:hypothetical protein